ncbi:hypothetical protein ScPMuIL_006813 [Solemya velum]
MADGEVVKLQNHLKLLREEYVKLQDRLADTERKYQVAAAAAGQIGDDSFVARLLQSVAELFNKELYSDVKIHLKDAREVWGHKFVLSARSDEWGVEDLSQTSELDMSDINYDVAFGMLKWVYTDVISIKTEDTFLLELLRAATKFKLVALRKRCEIGLMSFVNMKNCIHFYQTAEEMGADLLKAHCSELISNHWNDFTSDDFTTMSAPLLYKMFKTKTEYPLHTAIRIRREDVVFLFLMENDSQLSVKVNEIDNQGDLPLDLVLSTKQEGLARTLLDQKADVNRKDNSGKSLLHKAIKRGDEFAAAFLIQNSADVNMCTHLDKETPLHLVARFNPDVTLPEVVEGMAKIAKMLVDHCANLDAQDTSGSTPLHTAIFCKNTAVFTVLLETGLLNLELKNSDGHTALWLALQQDFMASDGDTDSLYDEKSFASQLLMKGSSPDAIEPESGDSLLHIATRFGNEAAGLFLAGNGARVNVSNNKGETPLHIACEGGLGNLVKSLLDRRANPNTQTLGPSSHALGQTDFGLEDDTLPVARQTPLHLALLHKHSDIVELFLEHKVAVGQSSDNTKVIPNFNLKDSEGQTVLGLALWNGLHREASRLLGAGANINEKNAEGLTLLHQAIEKQDTDSSLFLLEHQADINIKTVEDETPLQHAIKRHLPVVVDNLCKRGAAMSFIDKDGSCPIWQALDSGQEDIAQILVKHGCDLNQWTRGPEGCQQTLLHRAIDENNEAVACFLIKSGCNKNSPRRPGPHGEGADEARDGQTPLHLACAWGLELIVQCLMEYNADVNIQDIDGKTSIHVAIENQHPVIISLLLSHPGLDLTIRDKQGLTPFAAAMMTKNNKAAQAILNREPTAAEQVDNRGRNFLHLAIQKCDIESVLFLISVHANVNSTVQDNQRLSPLHLAVLAGSEMIVRNLMLAGAIVNVKNARSETALHLSATKDQASICAVLIENGVDYDDVDENLNNALHLAVQYGNLNTARVLLTQSHINAEALNIKGKNPLHILGQYGKDSAAAIFELFRESMPEYPIDKPDNEGNTALLLAYVNGNGNLCRALVRAGACMGATNKDGLGIFNAPVATRQLLFKLLDMLSKEPPWCEGESCVECGTKFSIKTRKHHCRHCGRILCAKCSSKDVPIVKYNLSKPVRTCDICFDVLTFGGDY